jgi:hypothetical protein
MGFNKAESEFTIVYEKEASNQASVDVGHVFDIMRRLRRKQKRSYVIILANI